MFQALGLQKITDTRFLPSERERDADSLTGDLSKKSVDFSGAEDPAKVPTSPATHAALWALGSPHA